MAVIDRNTEDKAHLMRVAEKMAAAARTAPKTRGKDMVDIAIVEGESLGKLADEMKKIAEEYKMPFFARDADNLLNSHVAVLIGCRIRVNNLNPCGMCGFENCDEKENHPEIPCIFNPMDMGIAIGSAVSVAADERVDNRVLYTLGQAVLRLGMMSSRVKAVCGIPLSVKGKNIFFDRK